MRTDKMSTSTRTRHGWRKWLTGLSALFLAQAAAPLPAIAAPVATVVPPPPTTPIYWSPDSGGENDIDPSSLNNQSDLSAYGINRTGAASATTQYGWKWDEPGLSGNNSLDACVYLSSTETGTSDPNAAEYAVCYDLVVENGVPVVQDVTYWYCPTFATADATNGGQKCYGNSNELPAGPDSATMEATAALLTGAAAQFATDPDKDTQVILDLTSNLELSLVNVRSKKSASPSSDSSDCALERAPAFLKLIKVVQDGTAVPSDTTPAAKNR